MLSHGLFRRESRGQPRSTHQTSNPNDSDPQLAEGSQPILLVGTTAGSPRDSLNQNLRNQPEQIATPRPSSYISFDGANSTLKIPVKESWIKTIWDRFSHLLVASSRASLNSKKRRQTKAPTAHAPKSSIREIQVSPPLTHGEIQAQSNPAEARTPTSRAVGVIDIRTVKGAISETPQQTKAQPVKTQQAQQQGDPAHHEARPSTPKSTTMETQASRTASWAASLSPMLRKSKFEEPRVKWASPFTDGEDMIAEIKFTPSRTDTETVPETTDFSQISLEISSGANILPKKAHLTTPRTRDKGKGKAISEFHTPTPSQSESLTRTHSQQQYLLDREADKEARRDRNILKAKYKGRKMKEKADQQAEQFKRLNILHSKKACPLGKWSNRDQVELELLRMKLGLRGARNSWKKNDLRRLGMAELQELRESLLPAARIASNQPKGQSPVQL